jgi:hypothetical protein
MRRRFMGLVCLWGVSAGCAPPDTVEREAPPLACGPVLPWAAGGRYNRGSKVTARAPLHVFECRPWPYEGWCPNAAYAPTKVDGPWADAWVDMGPCPKEMVRELPAEGEPH